MASLFCASVSDYKRALQSRYKHKVNPAQNGHVQSEPCLTVPQDDASKMPQAPYQRFDDYPENDYFEIPMRDPERREGSRQSPTRLRATFVESDQPPNISMSSRGSRSKSTPSADTRPSRPSLKHQRSDSSKSSVLVSPSQCLPMSLTQETLKKTAINGTLRRSGRQQAAAVPAAATPIARTKPAPRTPRVCPDSVANGNYGIFVFDSSGRPLPPVKRSKASGRPIRPDHMISIRTLRNRRKEEGKPVRR